MAKHFLKAVTLFAIIIILGLAGFAVVNYLEQSEGQAANVGSPVQVAK
jgi:hypothetical protein